MASNGTVVFRCPEHGLTNHHECLLCRAKDMANKIKSGEEEVFLLDGDGPEITDPSPTTISLRSKIERDTRVLNKTGGLVEDEFEDDLEEEDVEESHSIRPTPGEDAFDFIKNELKTTIDLKFWVDLQNCIDKEMGKRSVIKMHAMSSERRQKFLDEVIPFGRYAGKTIRYVVEKDSNHLIKLAYRPDLFQSRLRTFLMGLGQKEQEDL